MRPPLSPQGAHLYSALVLWCRWFILFFCAITSTGCVQRLLTVKSDPPGALVYLNGQEFGRTPVTREFTWYGVYDVQVRKEGYETLKTEGKVIAPWWQWVPLDLFTEVLPLTDRHTLSYRLQPTEQTPQDPQAMLERAEAMRSRLRSSRYTRQPPTTAPATAPAPKSPGSAALRP